jgi:predicted nucleic acid-binding protein
LVTASCPSPWQFAQRWGDLSAQLKAKGRPRPVIDSILAATALTHGLFVVTRNVKDYEDLTATVLNPWETST